MATVATITIEQVEKNLHVLCGVIRYPQTVLERSGLNKALADAKAALERARKAQKRVSELANQQKPAYEIRKAQDRVARSTGVAHEAVQAAWVFVRDEKGQRPIDTELIGWCAHVTGIHLKELDRLESLPNFNEWIEQDPELGRLYQAAGDGIASADNHEGGADQRYQVVRRNFGRLKTLRQHYEKLARDGGPAIAIEVPVIPVETAVAEVTA